MSTTHIFLISCLTFIFCSTKILSYVQKEFSCLLCCTHEHYGALYARLHSARNDMYTHSRYTHNVHYMEVCRMANIKSAKKRILTSAKKTAANKAVKSSVKTAIKKVHKAVEAGDKEAAVAALTAAESTIDRACTKGVLHKNNASRKVSRLASSVNKI